MPLYPGPVCMRRNLLSAGTGRGGAARQRCGRSAPARPGKRTHYESAPRIDVIRDCARRTRMRCI